MWIARNKSGQLMLFEGRPMRDEENEMWDYYTIYSNCTDRNIQHFSAKILDREMFPELKWEDEPMEVILLPKPNDAISMCVDIPFVCELCSSGHCFAELKEGKQPTCIHYEKRIA